MAYNILAHSLETQNRTAEQIIETVHKMVLAKSMGCSFGKVEVGLAAAVPLPTLRLGDLSRTEGRGASNTSFSVRTGYGDAAGGKKFFAISGIRPPAWTGDMYGGTSLYPRHRFPL